MIQEIILQQSAIISFTFHKKIFVLKISEKTLDSKDFEIKICDAVHDLCDSFKVEGVQDFKVYGNQKWKGMVVSKLKKVWPSLGLSFVSSETGTVFCFDEKNNVFFKKEALKKTSSPVENRKVKVLIVDDSSTITKILKMMIESDPGLECIGVIHDPTEIESFLKKSKPDVVTCDINMPNINGVECLKRFFVPHSIPTIMVSALRPEDSNEVLDALEAGAIDYFKKPEMNQMQEFQKVITEKLIEIGKSNAKEIISEFKNRKLKSSSILPPQSVSLDPDALIVIGSSTGGTEALKDLLTCMPKNIPPILIVQHIPPVFSKALADRINSLCPFEVVEASHGLEIKKNTVYIAPGGSQMKVRSGNGKIFLEINDDPPMTRHKPSVDYLFQSVSKLNHKNLYAVMLTGMGGDGSKEMLRLRQQGARTIAQSERTCVVYGMPKEAVRVGAVEEVSDLLDIPAMLSKMMSQNSARKAS